MVTDNLNENLPTNPRLMALHHQSSKLPSLFHQGHSTPSAATPGRSDDSLYGFGTALQSPLPFSPVTSNPHLPSSPSGSVYSITSSMSTSISPGKRKLQLGVFDMPMERPSKKVKKKKTKQVKQEVSPIIPIFTFFKRDFIIFLTGHNRPTVLHGQ
jgi:hypothetical protein